MDSSPPSAETSLSTAGQPQKHHAPLRWAYAILGLLFLALLLALILSPGANQRFTWMTPEQVTQALKPGPLTLLKYRVQRALGPLMRYYPRNHPNIVISSSIMTISTDAAAQITLGAPIHTDTSSARAWILSPEELASFRRTLKTNSGVVTISSPRIQTGDGMQARVMMGQSINLSPGVSTNIGTTVDTLAKSSHGSVNLLLTISSTELANPKTPTQPTINTNFSAACRALVPDAGAVVISCGQASAANPVTYWLILSPVLVDARGIPIKP